MSTLPSHEASGRQFVFRAGNDGSLRFIGDFEGLYRAEADPWGQSGNDARLGTYYRASRGRLLRELRRLQPRRVIEVGCGHGHVAERIRTHLSDCEVVGVDVSATALGQARTTYPNITYHQADIREAGALAPVGHADVVLLNQILWYVLDALDHVTDNAKAALRPGGHMIWCNAFFRGDGQRFGRDIVDGFAGLVRYIEERGGHELELIEAQLRSDPAALHDDGLVIMRKRAA
jgi:SAM-dependent methyltransferase